MKMIRYNPRAVLSAFLAVSAVALFSGQANAAEITPHAYVGGELSFNRTSGLGGKIDEALAAQGTTASSTAKNSSTNGSLKLGYRVNRNLAVEATYDRVGKQSVNSTISAPTADTASGNWKAHGLGVHAVGIAPIDDKVSVFGRVGVERFHTSLGLASNSGGSTAISESGSNTSLVLGAGASYALTRNVDATAELTHYNHVGNSSSTGRTSLNTVNLGVVYHFM